MVPDGTSDPIVLQGAADAGRILVTGDLRTMRVHFQGFVARRDSPGVLLVLPRVPLARRLKDC